jgi:hypothetical protein
MVGVHLSSDPRYFIENISCHARIVRIEETKESYLIGLDLKADPGYSRNVRHEL